MTSSSFAGFYAPPTEWYMYFLRPIVTNVQKATPTSPTVQVITIVPLTVADKFFFKHATTSRTMIT